MAHHLNQVFFFRLFKVGFRCTPIHQLDVDLFIGGVTEIKPQNGALLGPTFTTIVAKQFDVLKHADRFFYNDPYQSVSFTSIVRRIDCVSAICYISYIFETKIYSSNLGDPKSEPGAHPLRQ